MSNNIKKLTLLSLGAVLIISSGLIIGNKFASNKAKAEIAEKNNKLIESASDVTFDVEEVNESADNTDKDLDAEEKENDSKENIENSKSAKDVSDSKNEINVGAKSPENKTQNTNKSASNGNTESIIKNKTQNANKVSVDPATYEKVKSTVLNNDSIYLKELEVEYSSKLEITNESVARVDKETADSIKESLGIDVSECYYAFALREDYGISAADYCVDTNSGKVYCIPNQGNMDAYEIKDNKVVQTYKYKKSEESWRWR